ncbi:hypothetical protein [Bradyrhizobium centrosematis]|uniref:hypothetical protein n=1 Tax=Bradyrhizobium centrosematis TaxID=1300039 RepID=UPI00388D7DA9
MDMILSCTGSDDALKKHKTTDRTICYGRGWTGSFNMKHELIRLAVISCQQRHRHQRFFTRPSTRVVALAD